MTLAPQRLATAETAARLAGCPGCSDTDVTLSGADLVLRAWPPWVRVVGFARGPHAIYTYLAPEMGTSSAGAVHQAVIDVPAGRYLVEALDASDGRPLAVESAGGGPLVIGIPSTGGPIVLRIRCTATA